MNPQTTAFICFIYCVIGVVSALGVWIELLWEPGEVLAVLVLWPIFALMAAIRGAWTVTERIWK